MSEDLNFSLICASRTHDIVGQDRSPPPPGHFRNQSRFLENAVSGFRTVPVELRPLRFIVLGAISSHSPRPSILAGSSAHTMSFQFRRISVSGFLTSAAESFLMNHTSPPGGDDAVPTERIRKLFSTISHSPHRTCLHLQRFCRSCVIPPSLC